MSRPKRPQSHRDNFPFLDDEDYYRPILPDEFEARCNAYYKQQNEGISLFQILLIVLVGVILWILVGGNHG